MAMLPGKIEGTLGGLSMRKTCVILRDCFGLQLIAGGFSQALDRLATKVQCQYQAIVKELPSNCGSQ
jgi:hypothetical protein